MKFKSIDRFASRKGSIVVRTDPHLTKEVFDRAKGTLPPDVKHSFSPGYLVIEAHSISKDDIVQYEGALSNAERNIKREKDASEDEYKKWLHNLSDESGLPLE